MTEAEYQKEIKAFGRQLSKELITPEEYWRLCDEARREYERSNQKELTPMEGDDDDE